MTESISLNTPTTGHEPSPLPALFARLNSPRYEAAGAFGGKRRHNGAKIPRDWRQTRRGYLDAQGQRRRQGEVRAR